VPPPPGSSSLLQELHQVYSDHRVLSLCSLVAVDTCSIGLSWLAASSLFESVSLLHSPIVVPALWAAAVIPSLTKPVSYALTVPCAYVLHRLLPGLSGIPWVNPTFVDRLTELATKVPFVSTFLNFSREHGLLVVCAMRLASFLYRLLVLVAALLLTSWASSPSHDLREDVSAIVQRMLGFFGITSGKRFQENFDTVYTKGGPIVSLMLLGGGLLFPFAVLSPVLARRLLYLSTK